MTVEDRLVYLVLDNLNISKDLVIKKRYREYPEITAYTLIKGLLEYNSGLEFGTYIGYSKRSIENICKTFRELVNSRALNKFILVDKLNYRNALLSLVKYKFCSACTSIKETKYFHSNISRKDNKQGICTSCSSLGHKVLYKNNKLYYKINAIKYKVSRFNAMPKWANYKVIKEIYASCPIGYHVDHIVPLQNDLVCGLHCEFNLQHLSAQDNLSKGNKFII